MSVLVVQGDARDLPLPDASVDLIVTSPPYFGLRSYTDGGEHYAGQIGSEATPAEYVAALVACTREWVRVLKPSGSLFVNLGDKYAGGGGQWENDERPDPHRRRAVTGKIATGGKCYGSKPKSLLGLPWRYALNVTDQLGLILRAEIIWAKPNGLPESVRDRVRRAHEQVFHFTVRPRYYSAVDEIREEHLRTSWATGKRLREGREEQGPQHELRSAHRYGRVEGSSEHPLGKLPGSVWSIPSQPLTVPPALGVDHFAAFPMELPRRLILGWSPPGVCTGCGEGRRPVVAKPGLLGGDNNTERLIDGRYIASGFNGGQRIWAERMARPDYISGYACRCTDVPRREETAHAVPPPPGNPPTRPAIVLDPFGGTGTTALLAHTLGRTGITIDRSADYARIAAWRCTDPGERARAMQVGKPAPVPAGQDTLFEVTT